MMKRVALAAMMIVSVTAAGPLPVNMRTAGRYAVLSRTTTTLAGQVDVKGDLGQSPGDVVVNDGGTLFNGQYNVANSNAKQAQSDLLLARQDAASRPAQFSLTGALGGMTLIPGVYDSAAALGVAGILTFDAQGDPNAVWIIRSDGALTTAAHSLMRMIGGGCPSNVFFVLQAAATFGANSNSMGTTMALAAVTGGAGAKFGPVLSSTAAVSLSHNSICSYCRAGEPAFSSQFCCVCPGDGPLLPIPMGSAGRYSVLSRTTTTMAGLTVFEGDFGQFPGEVIVNDLVPVFEGEYDVANSKAEQAQEDLRFARQDAASRETSEPRAQFLLTGALGGLTLVPGVYDSAAALGVTGILTFDAQGDPNAVWIIRSNGAMTTAAASRMRMIGGGCPSNVFFVLDAAASFGAVSLGIGTTLAYAAITGAAGAIFGPVHSSTAAVTLSANLIGSYCTGNPSDSSAGCSCCNLEAGPVDGSPLPINLLTAGRYAVLAYASTTLAGLTKVNGDFGQSPVAVVVNDGFPVFNGQYNVANSDAKLAQVDLFRARRDALARPKFKAAQFALTGALSGMTLIPGVYDSSAAFGLTGVLTFDAQGDPNAVWIIRSNGALTTAASARMDMAGGGCAANVFFVLDGASTFGAISNSIGTTMAWAAITGGAGANFGPVLSNTAAITLSNNNIGSYCRTGEGVSSSDACVVDGCGAQGVSTGAGCTACSSGGATSSSCGAHGSCDAGSAVSCSCDDGFAGAACDSCWPDYYGFPACSFCLAGSTCSGNGVCGSSGGCTCNAGFHGSDCSEIGDAEVFTVGAQEVFLDGNLVTACSSSPITNGTLCLSKEASCDRGVSWTFATVPGTNLLAADSQSEAPNGAKVEWNAEIGCTITTGPYSCTKPFVCTCS